MALVISGQADHDMVYRELARLSPSSTVAKIKSFCALIMFIGIVSGIAALAYNRISLLSPMP